MSSPRPHADFRGGIDYASIKHQYDCDDYVLIPFAAAQDYYVVGTMAALADPNSIDVYRDWYKFAHGQVAAPAFLAPFLLAAGIPWPPITPAFEAKDLLFYATVACLIRFEGNLRVQHPIPATTFMRFNRRCSMFFVQQTIAGPGLLNCWLQG